MSAQTAVATQTVKEPLVAKKNETESLSDRIEKFYNSIERRAFEIFENNGRRFGRERDDWLQAESELFHPIHLEISETDENLNVRAEVPGFKMEELEINVESNRLSITGRHEDKSETKKGKTVYSEQCAKEIMRVVDLPAEVQADEVETKLKDGVLNIQLKKTATAKIVPIKPDAVS